MEQLLISVYDDIPESTWTDLDRTTLRRPKRSTDYTSAIIVEFSPLMTLVERMHLGLKFHFQNPKTPDSEAMPLHQHISLEYFIGAKGLDFSKIVWGNAKEVRKFLYKLPFTEGDIGQYIYVRCHYVNSKGEPSVYYSAVFNDIIS